MIIAVAIVFASISCNKNNNRSAGPADESNSLTNAMMLENGNNPDEMVVQSDVTATTESNSISSRNNRREHFLYTETNAAGTNQILRYEINRDGSLHFDGTTLSGGAGSGAGLGSQGALALDKDHEWLFAVNAGGNSVSSFKVENDGSLTLAHTESTMGETPVSVAVRDNLLYVLNRGSDNIHGFMIGSGGSLTHIDGSTQSLSGKTVDAPQISFTPNGNWVLVTEKATNNISSFKVKNNGSVSPGIVTASTGETPFGFDFGRDDVMVVSNAAGGAADAGSATSYIVTGNGKLHSINGAVANHQGAPCWVATTEFGRFAFVSNTGSNSISSYYIAPNGRLYLIKKAAAPTDNAPADIVVAKDNFHVYALNVKSGTISEFHRTMFGGLEAIGTVSGLPVATTGLARY